MYREIDVAVSECLVDPMFISLEELISDADERDIEVCCTTSMISENESNLCKLKNIEPSSKS